MTKAEKFTASVHKEWKIVAVSTSMQRKEKSLGCWGGGEKRSFVSRGWGNSLQKSIYVHAWQSSVCILLRWGAKHLVLKLSFVPKFS